MGKLLRVLETRSEWTIVGRNGPLYHPDGGSTYRCSTGGGGKKNPRGEKDTSL